MSVKVNFHIFRDDKLSAVSQSFEGSGSHDSFVTFELNSGANSVTVYLRNVEDAKRLLDAAVEAYRNVEALELERRIDSVVKVLPVFGGDNLYDGIGETEESKEMNSW